MSTSDDIEISPDSPMSLTISPSLNSYRACSVYEYDDGQSSGSSYGFIHFPDSPMPLTISPSLNSYRACSVCECDDGESSGSSYGFIHFPDLFKSMSTMQRYLNHPGCQLQSPNRRLLKANLEEAKRKLCSKDHNDSDISNNITGDKGPESSTNKMSELQLLDMLSGCWISQIESGATPTELESELLQALLCFFLFEEAAVMKKRDLIYWWVGQGVINVDDGKDAEEAANAILKKLVEAGAIEPVYNSVSRKEYSSKYRLTSIYHQQHQINNVDHKNLVGVLKKEKATMMLIYPDGTTIDKNSRALIETLFNPSVSVIGIERDWLRKMRNLKVLHLGKWLIDPEQHIQVETVEFFKDLKYLKHVKFASFRGLSRIMELGDEICNLGDNLRVLDLKACPNLEVISKGIGKLKNLTHLDLSECYMLDRIPKEITSLTKLQVLEGFVIGDINRNSSCNFKDLANYLATTLRKLSIRTRKVNFPGDDDLKAFAKFEKLLKLKIVWINVSDSDEDKASLRTQEATLKTKDGLRSRSLVNNLARTFRREVQQANGFGLPEQLRKLEVQAIPQKAVENLLLRNKERLNNLKKLYIIGGELSDLSDDGKNKWEMVKTLRLRYLTKLHMNWRQFKATFPHVTYVDMTQCPHLSFFPCDQNGLWKLAEDDF